MGRFDSSSLSCLRDYRAALSLMLSQSGPVSLCLMLFGLLIARVFLGGISALDVFVLVAFLGLRGFVEWGLHLYIFNASPLPVLGWRLCNPISVMHGHHHANPEKLEMLFFGWKGVVVVVLLSFIVLSLLFDDVGLAVSGVLAAVVNLLLYEWFHLIAHSSISPRSPRFRRCIDNHRRHHYVNGNMSFGVSSIIADKVFKTYVE